MHDETLLIETTADDSAAVTLFAEQEAELMRRYGGDDTGPRPAPGSPTLLLRVEGEVVGCVALALDDGAGVAEIKRMYVAARARGRGLSRLLLAGVERLAARRGVELLRLVTGVEQPEAIALYSSAGYELVPGFGYWVDEPTARFFVKRLAPEVADEA